MRELIVIFLLIAIGPLLFISDGAIKQDYDLRRHSLEPVKISTSLNTCRTKAQILQRCRYAYIDENNKHIVYRYILLSFEKPQKVEYLQSAQTGQITTNVGQDYFWNRILVIVLFSIMGLMALFPQVANYFSFEIKRPAPIPPQPRRPNPPIRNSSGQGFGRRTGYR